jgi:hypothetical protein
LITLARTEEELYSAKRALLRKDHTMYFDAQQCRDTSGMWIGGILEPWLEGLILGIQRNTTDTPPQLFSTLKSVWNWRITNLFGLICKPILLILVFCVSMAGFSLKLAFMLVLLPVWLLIAITTSMKFGLPDYPQTWVSPHD